VARVGALAALLVMSACATGGLSDGDIAAFAARPYDKADKQFAHDVLGEHHGARVVVDYPCSDVCPAYTAQIIHYDVKPGVDCDRIGGKTVARTVPRGIAVTIESFCVPAILAR
jgi:NAD-dependent dihydropyrimidine dehydrogenase PreA subunit